MFCVIAGLGPAIHHFREEMDARVEPGHDGIENGVAPSAQFDR